jgi:acyl-CoA reductase-like NAD-dependent aldehyde dehydrogenase
MSSIDPTHHHVCAVFARTLRLRLVCYLIASSLASAHLPCSTHIINGEKHTSVETLEIISPTTRQPCETVPRATQADVDAAVAGARAAFPAWAATPWSERAAAVAKLGDLCEHYAAELSALLTRETGKPLKTHSCVPLYSEDITAYLTNLVCDSGWEMYGSAAWFRGIAGLTLPEERTETPESTFVQCFTPLGVGAAIVPWNYPMILMTLKVR